MLALMTILSCLAGRADAAPLVIAASSDLAYCVNDLAAAFQSQEKGAQLRFVLDSSENLYVKLSQDIPMDVYLSADMRYQANLIIDGKADPDTWTIYAIGRIVIWSLDKRFDVTQGMRLLADPRIKRIAIPNPPVHPYGRAAFESIGHGGLSKATAGRLLLGDDILKTAHLIQAGKAQAGVVSYATVLAPPFKGVGNYYLIPAWTHDLVEQGAIVTKQGKSNPLSLRFVHFLQTPKAQAILNRHGFLKPPMDDERARRP